MKGTRSEVKHDFNCTNIEKGSQTYPSNFCSLSPLPPSFLHPSLSVESGTCYFHLQCSSVYSMYKTILFNIWYQSSSSSKCHDFVETAPFVLGLSKESVLNLWPPLYEPAIEFCRTSKTSSMAFLKQRKL